MHCDIYLWQVYHICRYGLNRHPPFKTFKTFETIKDNKIWFVFNVMIISYFTTAKRWSTNGLFPSYQTHGVFAYGEFARPSVSDHLLCLWRVGHTALLFLFCFRLSHYPQVVMFNINIFPKVTKIDMNFCLTNFFFFFNKPTCFLL